MAKDFKSKLAAALRKMKAEGANSATIPLDRDDPSGEELAESLDEVMSVIMGNIKNDDKPKDETPVSQEMIDKALAIITDLAKPEAQLAAYVEAFSNVLLIHNELHESPVYRTKLHEHVIAFGESVHNIAAMRFGEDAFYKAVHKFQTEHKARVYAKLTDELLGDASDYFKSLRPRARAN